MKPKVNYEEPNMQFENLVKETYGVRDGNLLYNFERKGPMMWHFWNPHESRLIDQDYDVNPVNNKPFRMQSFPEAVRLAYFAVEHKEDTRLQSVIDTLHNYTLTGDTLVLGTAQGFYVIDHPDKSLLCYLSSYDEHDARRLPEIIQTLRDRLSSREEQGVIYSKNGNVRFTPIGKEQSWKHTPLQLAKNPRVIALAGSGENAELIAAMSKHYRYNPHFHEPFKIYEPTVRVPCLNSMVDFKYWLDIFPFTEDSITLIHTRRNYCAFGAQ